MFTNSYFPAFFIDSYFIPVGVDIAATDLLPLYVRFPTYATSNPTTAVATSNPIIV